MYALFIKNFLRPKQEPQRSTRLAAIHNLTLKS